jgi:predicted ABC-type ATPase
MAAEKSEEQPYVIAFAGPNGSGKSTVTSVLLANLKFKGEYINADEIGKSLENEIPNYRERNIRAANIAEQRRLAAFAERRPVAFETVMSTPEKIALLSHAKEQGYKVILVFVTTDDPEKNVQRVANRVALGRHAVEPDAVRERYARTMQLLGPALDHADLVRVYDNSTKKLMLVAVKNEGELQLHNLRQHPNWVKPYLVDAFLERVESRNRITEVFQKDASSQAVLKDADAAHRKRYTGPIIGLTQHHALQKISAHSYVVHDRSLSDSKGLEAGKNATIEYAFYKGKIVTPDTKAVMAFENEPPQVAIAKYPRLAGAYAMLSAVEKRAQADGLDQAQRDVVIGAAQANIVKRIEAGSYPEVKIREEIEVKQEQSADKSPSF